jgi:hypothetical protein
VADPKPFDAWQVNTEHYFVFELRPDGDAAVTTAPVALFKMRWEENGPVLAVVITPSDNGASAEVRDLRWPQIAPYAVPLSAGGAEQDKPAKE